MGISCFFSKPTPGSSKQTKSAIPAQQLAEALDVWLPACGATWDPEWCHLPEGFEAKIAWPLGDLLAAGIPNAPPILGHLEKKLDP